MLHGSVGRRRRRGLWLAAVWLTCGVRAAAAAQDEGASTAPSPVMTAARDAPPADPLGPPSRAGPPSLGQQPLPTEQPVDQTPSQTNTNQFNQLFLFGTTPDVCAAGEGYVSAQFLYFDRFPTAGQQYRPQVRGQYGVTDQWAVGALVPGVINEFAGDGLGDVELYAQYKFDRFINPEVVDVTGQVDVVLPTGSSSRFRGTGRFGVRPRALVYKDFGRQGPGILGLYGTLGFTVSTHSDLRLGVAATYEINRLAAVVELQESGANLDGQRLATFTPGLIYRGITPLEVAVGVPVGISERTPNVGVVFKLTYAFQN